ncbi:prolyl 4-hydroxylase subunit alpha-2-like [Pecten maximus]|uniref:prolyl 4-hydroxylase subunit alpha-2-like n=1 Tax=Pecten maximus TaxID=6579 RepID=UPI00145898AC|nr:prolyl 4-hydroxylase subunit alpha-2-like [Pecten maximus]
MELIWYSVFLLWTLVGADVSTSGYKLTVVCLKEGQLLEVLDRYVSTTLGNSSNVDESIQSFLGKVKEERSKIKDINEWIGHPINAYHLVKRTAKDWRSVQQSINCSTCVPTIASEEFHSSWKQIIEEEDIWTSSEDIVIALQGLARLIEMYDLEFTALMSGTILNISSSPLTNDDAINIATHLEKEPKITWIKALLDTEGITEKEALLYDLAMTYHMVGKSRTALDILTDLQKISNRSMTGMIKIVKQAAEKPEDIEPHKGLLTRNEDLNIAYKKLCQGKVQKTKAASVLRCYNKATRIPYYTGKEEVLNAVPRISQFHDTISDEEILQILDASKEQCNCFISNITIIIIRLSFLFLNSCLQLTPAVVVKRSGLSKAEYRTRSGETSWIHPAEKISIKLEKRIELLTGLDRLTAEYFEIVNYGLGGHYLRHYDALDLQNMKNLNRDYTYRNRIATWMFYLSSVEAGGATVFPLLNVKIPPIKNSAVFWYNLLPSGERDDRSQHASCPRTYGVQMGYYEVDT